MYVSLSSDSFSTPSAETLDRFDWQLLSPTEKCMYVKYIPDSFVAHSAASWNWFCRQLLPPRRSAQLVSRHKSKSWVSSYCVVSESAFAGSPHWRAQVCPHALSDHLSFHAHTPYRRMQGSRWRYRWRANQTMSWEDRGKEDEGRRMRNQTISSQIAGRWPAANGLIKKLPLLCSTMPLLVPWTVRFMGKHLNWAFLSNLSIFDVYQEVLFLKFHVKIFFVWTCIGYFFNRASIEKPWMRRVSENWETIFVDLIWKILFLWNPAVGKCSQWETLSLQIALTRLFRWQTLSLHNPFHGKPIHWQYL